VLIHFQVRVRTAKDEIDSENEINFSQARGVDGDGQNSSSFDVGKAMGSVPAADVPEKNRS